MPRRLKLLLLALLAACCADVAAAQESPSVYRLGYERGQSQSLAGQAPRQEQAGAAVSRQHGATRLSLEEPAEAVASGVARREPTHAAENRLPLAPRSANSGRPLTKPATASAAGAVGSVVGSLAVVLGLFLAVVWLSRRLGPAGSAPLPKEAVELLGRTTVSPQHTLQLVRVGGRLLLVALSSHGAATLTEIVDPAEVERLSALCLRQRPGSVSASFRETVTQLERETAGRSFVDQRRPAASVAATRPRTNSRA
jgi:flagellar biogenesis protein FliO